MSKPGKQTSKASKPRLTIESQDEARAGAPGSQTANGSEPVDDEIDFHEAAGFIRGLGMLMWRYARSHPHTVLYGFIGFVLAAAVLAVLHAFSLFINVLGTYVHCARLQYVEFFGKFYEANGRLFKPLTLNTRYSNLRGGAE